MPTVRVSPKVTPIVQDFATTCWLACFQMLYQWKNKDKNKVWDLLDNSPGPYANPWQMYYDGIGSTDLLPAAKALSLRWGGGGELDIELLAKHLKSVGPVWAAGCWNSQSHIILLTGADTDTNEVFYLNPWRDHGGEQEQKKSMYWFNEGRGHWLGVNGSFMYW